MAAILIGACLVAGKVLGREMLEKLLERREIQ